MAGDTSDAGQGVTITSCPASLKGTVPCTGSFDCTFQTSCTCHGCCTAFWRCVDGVFQQTDFNDVCAGGLFCPDGGSAGTSGGSAGTSGGGTGGESGGAAGGTSGTGGAPMTSCPATSPMVPEYANGPACDGTFSCQYQERCRCGVCCQTFYRCENGHIRFLQIGDACMMVTCDAGAGPDGSTGVCTPGFDLTCNDNAVDQSFHGHCNGGSCECSSLGRNPDGGRCL